MNSAGDYLHYFYSQASKRRSVSMTSLALQQQREEGAMGTLTRRKRASPALPPKSPSGFVKAGGAVVSIYFS